MTEMTTTERSTAEWQALDRQHLHPFTDYSEIAKTGSRIITRGEGVYLWDSEGSRLIDGMAGLWNVNIGYGRRELADAAHHQMLELPYYNTFFKTATPPSIELSRVLGEITPSGLEHVFYASSGSEANDTIVRMVRHFWNLMGKPDKKTLISREYAYHGSTMVAASLGGMKPMHDVADLPLPGFVHVMPPYWYDYGDDLSPEAFGVRAAKAIEDKILELGPDRIAAFIGEPIQGAGGVIIPPASYWPEVQRICREYDVLLIVDEVICGFGRLGAWFGCDAFDIAKPDFMTLAKGITSGYLPLSAVMVGDRVATTLLEEGDEFTHGFTYSGHPVPCAVALENIRIMQDERLVEWVANETGPHFAERLQALADHPLVGEVRVQGLIAAVELVADKAARRHFDDIGRIGRICRDHCFAQNVVLRAVRDCMVSAPPLVISIDEIDELIDGLARCLDLTAADIGA
jgi:putrescine aminotransferase